MEVSKLGYFNTFYSGAASSKKSTGSIGGYLAKYEETLGSGQGEKYKEKDGLDVKQENLKKGQTEVLKGSRLRDHLTGEDRKAPYYWLSDNGIIDYKGVRFICDTEHNQLHLGDTSDKKNCLTISLSGGGSLVVNRDNFDLLAKAITMFSPEDVNLIMRAISIDAKARQVLEEIEDEECSVGEEITDNGEDVEGIEETAGNEDTSVIKEGNDAESWKSTVYQSMSYEEKKD